mgnify:CR=1 FL=1
MFFISHHCSFWWVKLMIMNIFFHSREDKNVTGNQVWIVWGMGQSFDLWLGQKITCLLVVWEDALSWRRKIPRRADFGCFSLSASNTEQANCGVPFCSDYFLFFQWNCNSMTNSWEIRADVLAKTSWFPHFCWRILAWEEPCRWLSLHFQVILVYPAFVVCHNVKNLFDLPPLN